MSYSGGVADLETFCGGWFWWISVDLDSFFWLDFSVRLILVGFGGIWWISVDFGSFFLAGFLHSVNFGGFRWTATDTDHRAAKLTTPP